MSKLKELQEKRGKLYEELKSLLGKENETFDAEKRQKFDAINAEMETLKGDIDRIKLVEKGEAESRAVSEITSGGDKTSEVRDKEYREMFWRAMKRGCFVKGPIVGGMESLRWKPDVDEPVIKAKLDEYRNWKTKMLEKRDQEAGTQSISYTQGAAGGSTLVPAHGNVGQ